MKSYIRVKSFVVALILVTVVLASTGWTQVWGYDRYARTQVNQQVLVDRFDRIIELARRQHSQIQEWHRRAHAQDKQNKTVLKSKKVAAMQ